MVVEVAGTGASNLPQHPFILTLQNGHGQNGLSPPLLRKEVMIKSPTSV